MALEMSSYTEDKVIDRFLRNQSYTPPGTVYLALFTTATDDDGTGTEVAGGSYGRKAITFGEPEDGIAANTAAITFSGMPAATLTHAAIYDAASSGNMLWHGALTTSKTVIGGQSVTFSVGDVAVGFTPASSATNYLRNKIIDHMLRNQSYTPAATMYQALFSDDTDVFGGGTEVSGGSYSRKATTFIAPTNGITSNSTDVSFAVMPAVVVTHGAVFDASSGGNMLLQNPLASPVTLAASDTLTFPMGDITCTVQ